MERAVNVRDALHRHHHGAKSNHATNEQRPAGQEWDGGVMPWVPCPTGHGSTCIQMPCSPEETEALREEVSVVIQPIEYPGLRIQGVEPT